MTNPGQRILPGADLGREVPLPPQPPPESDREGLLRRHRVELDEWWAQMIADEESGNLERLNPSVESPDLPIPAEALEAAAAELYGSYGGGHRYQDAAPGVQAYWRDQASLVLAAALPHLRSLQVETQVAFGRALGRKEAAEEIATRLDRIVENVGHAVGPKEFGVGAGAVLGSYRHAAQIARNIGKGDPNG